jgi:hypothetical protein
VGWSSSGADSTATGVRDLVTGPAGLAGKGANVTNVLSVTVVVVTWRRSASDTIPPSVPTRSPSRLDHT